MLSAQHTPVALVVVWVPKTRNHLPFQRIFPVAILPTLSAEAASVVSDLRGLVYAQVSQSRRTHAPQVEGESCRVLRHILELDVSRKVIRVYGRGVGDES